MIRLDFMVMLKEKNMDFFFMFNIMENKKVVKLPHWVNISDLSQRTWSSFREINYITFWFLADTKSCRNYELFDVCSLENHKIYEVPTVALCQFFIRHFLCNIWRFNYLGFTFDNLNNNYQKHELFNVYYFRCHNSYEVATLRISKFCVKVASTMFRNSTMQCFDLMTGKIVKGKGFSISIIMKMTKATKFLLWF